MKVFKDVFEMDEELLSDSYPATVDGPFLVVKGTYVEKNNAVSGFEAGEEGVEDTVERVIDIVDAFGLQEIPLDKKGFQGTLKAYLTHLKEYLTEKKPELVAEFVEQSKTGAVALLSKFDGLKFFLCRNCNPEAQVITAEWNDEGIPIFRYWRHGLKEFKY